MNKNRLSLLPLLVQFVHKTVPLAISFPHLQKAALSDAARKHREELSDEEGITQNCIGFSVFWFRRDDEKGVREREERREGKLPDGAGTPGTRRTDT